MKAPRLTPALNEFLVVRLATAGVVARRELERACRAHGRPPFRELLALMAAADMDGRLTPSALADRVGLQRSEVSRLLNELKYEGRIEKRESLYDERSHVVCVPDRDAVLDRGRAALGWLDRLLRRNLTPLRQKQLEACLEAAKGPTSPVIEVMPWF